MMDDINEYGTSSMSFMCKPVNSEDVHSALEAELSERVMVDSEQIMCRLHIEDVSESFIADFLANFEQRQREAISSLKALVADAEDSANPRSKKSEEKAMCLYLENILDDITEFESRSAQRCFNNTHNMKLKGEAHLSGFPAVSPDFRCGQRVAPGDSYTWRGMDSFLEVKPTSARGLVPKSADPTKVAQTLAQTADYARLHLSSRPFQLFSIAVVVSSSKFVVAIFDRDGVTVSSDFDMWQDIEVFVRVIRQITHGLSPIELGQDPSVQELSGESPLFNSTRTKQVELGVPPATLSFPSYLVTCPRQLKPRPATPFDATEEQWTSDQWVTIGPPIWTSLSLCGRSTSVWRATRVEDNKIVNINEIRIVKNSWRRSNRDSESDIYQSIGNHPSGVAEFLQGGDVMFPGTTNVIRVDHLRNPNQAPGSYKQVTAILHRLLLNTTGRALWEGDSYLDIVKGVRAALKGHQDLCSQGILHRDVSPGNVLLPAESPPQVGKEGFLTDLDLARIRTIVKQDIQEHLLTDGSVVQSKFMKWNNTRHGAEMTGTIQFMAVELVEGLGVGRTVEHEARHDIESCIWVLAYALARRMFYESTLNKDLPKQTKEQVSKFFALAWGSASLTAIHTTKRALAPLRPASYTSISSTLLPIPIYSLFKSLSNLMGTYFVDPDPMDLSQLVPSLTYDDVFSRLDKCILALESPYNDPK